MPPRFDPEPDPKSANTVDTTKRYDVYYSEHALRTVVYRNVLFRGIRTLFSNGTSYDILSQMLELEQSNGQSVFVSRAGLIRFCEHGTDLSVETVWPK